MSTLAILTSRCEFIVKRASLFVHLTFFAQYLHVSFIFRYHTTRMRVLIVEDHEKIAQTLQKGLETAGFAVDYVLDGQTGEERLLLHHQDYDIVILDVMLPKKDGIALCADLRRANIATPIIMLTAKDTTEDSIKGLDAGADDYLVKPFSFDELIARIKALLRRPRDILPLQLHVGQLTLDAASRLATRNGKEIPLTQKEFMLLEYFMRHPNQVLTRELLLNHVWDFGFQSNSNVIDVHMKNLRTKVDSDYDEKLIETIRGVGYRLRG